MKAIVFGRGGIRQRLATLLADEGIEVIDTSDVSQAMAMVKSNGVDVAVIDGLVEESEAVCQRIAGLLSVPVVLTVGETQVNWERLQWLDVDGYISEAAGGAEIVARLRAVVRRHPGVNSLATEQCFSAE